VAVRWPPCVACGFSHRTACPPLRDLFRPVAAGADGRDVCVRVRRKPHVSSYPPLTVILAKIGRTGLGQGIAVPRLRRIAFLGAK
jgi:hypothetical protein